MWLLNIDKGIGKWNRCRIQNLFELSCWIILLNRGSWTFTIYKYKEIFFLFFCVYIWSWGVFLFCLCFCFVSGFFLFCFWFFKIVFCCCCFSKKKLQLPHSLFWNVPEQNFSESWRRKSFTAEPSWNDCLWITVTVNQLENHTNTLMTQSPFLDVLEGSFTLKAFF